MAQEVYNPQWGENRPIRGVLMDMDGLVLDSEILFSRFWRESCAHFGFQMSFQQSLQMRSQGKERGSDILKGFFGPTADYHAIRTKRIEIMEAYIAENGVALKPGIRELLEYLRENHIPAAITSSSPLDKIQEYMDMHGLTDYFTALCSGRDTPRGKPEPDIYLHGAASIGVDPRYCLGLEDSPAGLISAHRAGCLPIMIPDLDQPDGETEPYIYAVADSLLDIIDLIKRQNGR